MDHHQGDDDAGGTDFCCERALLLADLHVVAIVLPLAELYTTALEVED